MDNLNKLQAAHKFLIFWAVQSLNFFLWSAKTSAPENQIVLDFFFSHRLPRASPLLPSLSLSLFDLMALWSWRGALSKFKLPPKLLFWTLIFDWEQIERFQLQILCFLCIHFYKWEWIMEWKSICEILWNLKIKEILSKEIWSIIVFHPWNVIHSQSLFCAINVIQIPWTHIHKISFVNFQGSNGWSLIDKKF